MRKFRFREFILGMLVSSLVYFIASKDSAKTITELQNKNESYDKLGFVRLRDFIRYDCVNMVRIGGYEEFVMNSPDNLYRIDGAWFICMDALLAPKHNNCRVLSFGIDEEYSFDYEMIWRHECKVYSFDPYVEAFYFKKVRDLDPSLNESYVLEINDKWTFYK